jgi:Holliday junction resolvase
MKAAGKRIKGSRGELEVVKLFQARGRQARKVPLSGAIGGPFYGGDVIVGPADDEHILEVKRRRHGWVTLYGWLQDVNAVVFRRDKDDWLVCVRLTDYIDLIEKGD